MQIEKIRKKVKGKGQMNFSLAQEITDVIIKNNVQHILQLGFRQGVSTCYMAGALDELGRGFITSIDLVKTKNFEPNVEVLLKDLGLDKIVNILYEQTSYIWRLMKMIDEDPTPRFDLCFIDGAHDWFTDGFAFYLVDRLLKLNGVIIFNDLDWSYERSKEFKNSERVKKMPLDEKRTHQVRKVYELLVKPHPAYGRFETKNGWAYAYKIFEEKSYNEYRIKKEIIYENDLLGLKGTIKKIGRKIDNKH